VREEINELRRLLQAQQMQSSDNTSLMQNPSEGQGLAVSQETVTSGSTSAMPSVISLLILRQLPSLNLLICMPK
jgi:hypothetical protein